MAVPSSLAPDADDTLVAAVRRGDERAFETVYQRHHPAVFVYVLHRVRDHGRAEDITQEVFLSALRRLMSTDGSVALGPWLHEIARNACIDHFRQARRGEEVSYDTEGGRALRSGVSTDGAVEGKLALDDLCGAFGGLSRIHHRILVMRELEGLSYQEIGERLGLSRGAVESTLFRARRRLGEEYEGIVSGERCRRVQALVTAAGPGTLGVRDRRRVAAHLAHCQACRRHAYDASAVGIVGAP